MTQVIYENRRWWRKTSDGTLNMIMPRTHNRHWNSWTDAHISGKQLRYVCAQDGCYLCKVLIAEHAEAAQERWERQGKENDQIVKEWREARAHLKSVQARVDYVSRVVASDPNPERRDPPLVTESVNVEAARHPGDLLYPRTWPEEDVEPHTWTRIEGYLTGPQLPENQNPPWSKRTKKKKGKKNVR